MYAAMAHLLLLPYNFLCVKKSSLFAHSLVDGHWIAIIYFSLLLRTRFPRSCKFSYKLILVHICNIRVYCKAEVLHLYRVGFCVHYDIRIWFYSFVAFGTNIHWCNSCCRMDFPQKIEDRTTIWSSNTSSAYVSKGS